MPSPDSNSLIIYGCLAGPQFTIGTSNSQERVSSFGKIFIIVSGESIYIQLLPKFSNSRSHNFPNLASFFLISFSISSSYPSNPPHSDHKHRLSFSSFTTFHKMTTISWAPLPKVVFARVVKPFKPFEGKTVTDKNLLKNYRNLNPGDIIYLFETETVSKKWARGYVAILAMPSDFSSATVSTEKLPEVQVFVSLIPWACIQVLREVELDAVDNIYQAVEETDVFESDDNLSLVSSITKKKNPRPAVPASDFIINRSGLVEELNLAIINISFQIYSIYTRGDYENVAKLIDVYQEINDIRINLEYNLLSRSEIKLAKRKAAYLFGQIPKTVTASNNLVCESSHFRFKDVSGHQIIFARNPQTAELYTYKPDEINAKDDLIPVGRIAHDQLFCAIAPNFPICMDHPRFFQKVTLVQQHMFI
ncbi:unnamed protein product [Ambrosiozyma monospora]|uniref:Unnamed protein product n=1 Tax=Ambrosiozyma monospora TaxID=43982 RepID=A0ACB5T5S4_AMBMO|nr:unnamed protein product [Ambrosiozyma monospora]